MRRFLLPVLIAFSGCVPLPGDMPVNAAVQSDTRPSMTRFITKPPNLPTLSNADVARDFLDLSFQLESGRELPVLTRFEGPIRVRITGSPSASLGGDLGRLLHRLRSEAGLDISTTNRSSAEITIQAVPRDEIQRALPSAACFVAPNVTSLAQYRRLKHSTKINWSRLKRRDRLAIFIPNDVSPQEIRDCLHEELAQAIGPLNDLYRLPDSVFNDDNVHTILTAHDMLILRTYYHASLRNGMTRKEVAAKLPGILATLNPSGEDRAPQHLSSTPRNWISAVETALGPGASVIDRRHAGAQAVKIASDLGWTDHRRAFSHFAMGRLLLDVDAKESLEQFKLADRYYARTPHTDLHRAYVAAQLAAYAITNANAERALTLLSPHFDTAARHENAALLSTLMLLRVEALELQGRTAEAQAARLDSLGWARYGFGEDWAVRAKMYEISALNPLKGNTGGS